MGNEYDGGVALFEFLEVFEAFLLKGCVAHGQHFVDEQNIAFGPDGDGKSEADLHAGRVVFELLVHEIVEAGEVDATILSAAGLHRLGLDHVGTPIPFDIMLPAPGQGALGIECRAEDTDCMQLLKLLDDATSRAAVMAERAFARALGGSCHSPVAALATVGNTQVRLTAEILSEDGRARIRDAAEFPCGKEAAAEKLARDMLARAPEEIRRLFAAA